jgi:hypothetical protein
MFSFISNFVPFFLREHDNSNLLTTKQDGSLNNWFRKITCKTTPGISLNNGMLPQSKKKKEIIAVIDTQIDLKHEDLLGQIWTNKRNKYNGIDDDNAYVDDVNGGTL